MCGKSVLIPFLIVWQINFIFNAEICDDLCYKFTDRKLNVLQRDIDKSDKFIVHNNLELNVLKNRSDTLGKLINESLGKCRNAKKNYEKLDVGLKSIDGALDVFLNLKNENKKLLEDVEFKKGVIEDCKSSDEKWKKLKCDTEYLNIIEEKRIKNSTCNSNLTEISKQWKHFKKLPETIKKNEDESNRQKKEVESLKKNIPKCPSTGNSELKIDTTELKIKFDDLRARLKRIAADLNASAKSELEKLMENLIELRDALEHLLTEKQNWQREAKQKIRDYKGQIKSAKKFLSNLNELLKNCPNSINYEPSQ